MTYELREEWTFAVSEFRTAPDAVRPHPFAVARDGHREYVLVRCDYCKEHLTELNGTPVEFPTLLDAAHDVVDVWLWESSGIQKAQRHRCPACSALTAGAPDPTSELARTRHLHAVRED